MLVLSLKHDRLVIRVPGYPDTFIYSRPDGKVAIDAPEDIELLRERIEDKDKEKAVA